MKKRVKRLTGVVATLMVGGLGTALMLRRRRRKRVEQKKSSERIRRNKSADKWARPGMSITFRAELMPGRSASERTFRVKELLPSKRVVLEGVAGEHVESEFEPVR